MDDKGSGKIVDLLKRIESNTAAFARLAKLLDPLSVHRRRRMPAMTGGPGRTVTRATAIRRRPAATTRASAERAAQPVQPAPVARRMAQAQATMGLTAPILPAPIAPAITPTPTIVAPAPVEAPTVAARPKRTSPVKPAARRVARGQFQAAEKRSESDSAQKVAETREQNREKESHRRLGDTIMAAIKGGFGVASSTVGDVGRDGGLTDAAGAAAGGPFWSSVKEIAGAVSEASDGRIGTMIKDRLFSGRGDEEKDDRSDEKGRFKPEATGKIQEDQLETAEEQAETLVLLKKKLIETEKNNEQRADRIVSAVLSAADGGILDNMMLNPLDFFGKKGKKGAAKMAGKAAAGLKKPGILRRAAGGVLKAGKGAVGAVAEGAGTVVKAGGGILKRVGGAVASGAGKLVSGGANLAKGAVGAVKGGGAALGALGAGATAAVGAGAVKGAGVLGKAGAMAAKGGGGIMKLFGKLGSTTALKKIPIFGALLGGGLAAQRAFGGDLIGALGELTSALLATALPGIGTAGAVAIDAALLARDFNMDSETAGQEPTAGQAPVPPVRPPVNQISSGPTRTPPPPVREIAPPAPPAPPAPVVIQQSTPAPAPVQHAGGARAGGAAGAGADGSGGGSEIPTQFDDTVLTLLALDRI